MPKSVLRAFIIGLALIVGAAPLHAEWYRASSDHFVVYADDSLNDVHRFATKLERFHSAMALVLGSTTEAPSPSNRVTVYVVAGQRDVRELANSKSRYLGGFYIPRPSSSLAIVPRIARGGKSDEGLLTLFHEYAHHFLYASSHTAQPSWLNEGFAEFFGTVDFDEDGLTVGAPANHRAYELFRPGSADVEDILDPESDDTLSMDGFYGKSWLLYHYLTFSKERRGQLETYALKLHDGMSLKDAAVSAFGDLEGLEDDLDDYVKQRRMWSFHLDNEQVPVGDITVRPLREGEAAIMDALIRTKVGVDAGTAAEALAEARLIAAQYPDDAAVLSELAEAEFDAGNDAEAIAAADRAIALDAETRNAYIQKGYALFRIAEDADDLAAAYAKARQPFLKLNRIENDHALPLIYYYRSYRAAGQQPPESALNGLNRAVELAPFDHGLRMEFAAELILTGEMDRARHILKPVAYAPHANALSTTAQKWIEGIDAGAAPGDILYRQDGDGAATSESSD